MCARVQRVSCLNRAGVYLYICITVYVYICIWVFTGVLVHTVFTQRLLTSMHGQMRRAGGLAGRNAEEVRWVCWHQL